MQITQSMGWGTMHVYACARARARVRTCSNSAVQPFPYLWNGWRDCAEICYVVRDPLARRPTEVNGGIQLHVRTSFRYLGNGWTECTEIWYVVWGSIAMRCASYRMGDNCSGALGTHIKSQYIFSPARSSPKRRLTGFRHPSSHEIMIAEINICLENSRICFEADTWNTRGVATTSGISSNA